LWEIYYYLSYGLYTSAWNKIKGLSHDLRWKLPGDVYHYLAGMHEEVIKENNQAEPSAKLTAKTKAKKEPSEKTILTKLKKIIKKAESSSESSFKAEDLINELKQLTS